MFDRWRLAALLALALPFPAAGQDGPALERRVRAVDALRREALAAVERVQRARREPLDTFRAGSLVVVARPANAGLVRGATALAWTRLDSLFGDAAARLATTPLLFFLQGSPIRDAAPGARLQRVMAVADATTDDAAFQLVRAGSLAIREMADTALANWLGPMLLADVSPTLEQPRVYVELVTAPSIATRRCHAGALDGCATALAITEGDRVLLWFDAAERRATVRRMQADVRNTALRPSLDACLESDSDAACQDVLRGSHWVEPPFTHEARQSLVRVALASGGRRAFERLIQSAGRPLAQRLTIAGAIPLDSLLARWRQEILAARPKPVTLAASIGWTALGWCIVFGFLALRTTRWR
jgi:hypothetical protein